MGRRHREGRGHNWGNKPSFNVYFSTEGGSYDSPQFLVEDIGEMPESIMITCTCEIGAGGTGGTICMVGGNLDDSWKAGYMLYKDPTEGKLWWCVQMNANGSDEALITDRCFEEGEVIDICAQYSNGYARLYVDGELLAEGERNWVPAEGGLISLKTGSHREDEPSDTDDGITWISDLNVCRNGGKRFRRMKRVIAKFDDYVDSAEACCYDAGEMHDGVIMSCEAFINSGDAGALLHYGGNTDDSYLAGYILYWEPSNDGTFWWGIQMNANGSDPAITAAGYGPDEYSICGTYKNNHAELWIDDELVGESDCNWCMAEGGMLSLLTGSHLGDRDEAGEGNMAITDVYIATL